MTGFQKRIGKRRLGWIWPTLAALLLALLVGSQWRHTAYWQRQLNSRMCAAFRKHLSDCFPALIAVALVGIRYCCIALLETQKWSWIGVLVAVRSFFQQLAL